MPLLLIFNILSLLLTGALVQSFTLGVKYHTKYLISGRSRTTNHQRVFSLHEDVENSSFTIKQIPITGIKDIMSLALDEFSKVVSANCYFKLILNNIL